MLRIVLYHVSVISSTVVPGSLLCMPDRQDKDTVCSIWDGEDRANLWFDVFAPSTAWKTQTNQKWF